MNRTIGELLIVLSVAGLVGCDGQNVTAPTPRQPELPQAGGRPTLTGVTLFGVVTESTANGQTPVSDVSIYCDACGEDGHSWVRTDGNGYYSFSGDLDAGGGIWLSAGATVLLLDKEGYQSVRAEVPIMQDTRFDIQLAR
jgi:hypothetical protein